MPADVARFQLHSITERSPAAEARYLHPSALPKWRTLLALRWQERLEQVTELSLAYYGAEEDAAGPPAGRPGRRRPGSAAGRSRTGRSWPRSRPPWLGWQPAALAGASNAGRLLRRNS